MLIQKKFLFKICILIIISNFQLIKSINENEYNQTRLNNLREIAKNVNNNLQFDSNPCINFYSYVCSKKQQQQQQHSNKLIQIVDYDYVKNFQDDDISLSKSELKLKNYIKSCETKTTNYLEQLKNLEIAKLIDDWPFFKQQWNSNKLNIAQIYGLLNRYGILTNFQIRDKYLSNDISLAITPDLLYTEDEILNVFKKFDIKSEYLNLDDVANEIIKFNEEIIPYFSTTLNNEENENQQHEKFNLEQLKQKIPDFDWEIFFQEYFGKSFVLTNFEITLNSSENLQKFVRFLQNYDKKILANYFMLKLILNDEYPWTNDDCSVDFMLFVFNPLIAKINSRKDYNKLNEQLYLEGLDEIKNVLNELKGKSLITDTSFKEGINKVNEDIDFIIKNNQNVLNNDLIDEYYSDLEITSNNYLQNFYNYKSKRRAMKIDFEKTAKISKLFNYFNKITDLKQNPSLIVFDSLTLQFWNKFVQNDLELQQQYQYDKAEKCIKKFSDNKLQQQHQHIQIYLNEGLYLARKTYENWLEKNPKINEKENAILSEFHLNNKELLILYGTQEMCYNLLWAKDNGHILYNDALNVLQKCPEDKLLLCSVYKY